ncbi:MAG TPA: hypothetical protein DCS19_08510 [Flavobacterium sp.]|nr:hypothetical protein [Flavobacterium sp.]
MIFKDDQEAIYFIKKNERVDKEFVEMREYSRQLKALVNGEDFIDELIDKIEIIESDKKALARRKYSRDIKDVFSRLFQPIDNIYYATGGVKDYDIKPVIKEEFIKKIASIRDGKPLSEWVQHKAIQLFNTDPNGLIFLEYTTNPKLDVYPTYKSIDCIRHYKSKGQMVEYVLFEPKQMPNNKMYWRIVDDVMDRTFLQDGGQFTLVNELSFTHPFGEVPALICSNLSYVGEEEKVAAIDSVIGIAKELAQNQSILTLYKIFRGMPLFWKIVQFCGDCQGSGKSGDEVCGTCNGHGKYVGKNDVTDVIEVPLPEGDEKLLTGDNIGGYLSPELSTWTQFNDELLLLEEKMYKSHWGTSFGIRTNNNVEKTATEILFDKQPFENQLNKYADFAEYIEWKLSEWILNLYDTGKDRFESMITINLGRRYIIESYDVLLERYELAVKSQCNSIILDKIFEEYLWSKFRNNPIDLQISLAKAKCEPYLHSTVNQVLEVFGNEEAQKKILFQKYWIGVTDYLDTEKIKREFDVWFQANKVAIPQQAVIN